MQQKSDNVVSHYVFEAPVRIWHWLTVLCMAVLMVTGYFIGKPLPSVSGEATYLVYKDRHQEIAEHRRLGDGIMAYIGTRTFCQKQIPADFIPHALPPAFTPYRHDKQLAGVSIANKSPVDPHQQNHGKNHPGAEVN